MFHYISATIVAITIKVGRVVAYFESLLTIRLFLLLSRGLERLRDKQKSLYILNHFISTTTISMATKLVRMVIHLDRLLIIKSYKTLIMWSY